MSRLNKSDVINKLLPGALETSERFKVLPSVILAQAILETGWLGKCKANNLFGIKWTENCGHEKQTLDTHEWVRGVKTPFRCEFRAYKSYLDSFVDYGELLYYSNRYKAVVSAKGYEDACHELYKCGYCTDNEYPEKLIQIIEQNTLYTYDKKGDDDIKYVQSSLNTLLNMNLEIDGIIGPKTTNAIIRFQQVTGLVVDGISGIKTITAMKNILNKYTCSIKKPMDAAITRYIQYRVGARITGIWNNETDEKVKDFQSKNRLKIDGIVGKNTWNVLLY